MEGHWGGGGVLTTDREKSLYLIYLFKCIYLYILFIQTNYIHNIPFIYNELYIYIYIWGGDGGYHSHMHGTYENSMHVLYNLNISGITRNNIVDNILS